MHKKEGKHTLPGIDPSPDQLLKAKWASVHWTIGIIVVLGAEELNE